VTGKRTAAVYPSAVAVLEVKVERRRQEGVRLRPLAERRVDTERLVVQRMFVAAALLYLLQARLYLRMPPCVAPVCKGLA